MKNYKRLSEAEKLELYRVTLLNAKTREKFSSPLNEVGFSPESLDEGIELYEAARKAFDECKPLKSRRYEMHKAFHMLKADLDEKFQVDWKKAGIIFKRDIVAQDKLGLKNPYYRTYVKWIELARLFYTELSNNPDLTERLSKRNYSNEENSYFLKTSKLSGKGMVSALGTASRIARLANWDFRRNYVVHQVYHAKDFVFLGSAANDSSVTFKGFFTRGGLFLIRGTRIPSHER